MKSLLQFLSEASAASMQAKKLNLKSDGHGGWLDYRGKFVATTEDGKLKFVDRKKPKGQEEPTGKPRAAAKPEPRQNQRKQHLKRLVKKQQLQTEVKKVLEILQIL
jgi:hypothetical protein